MSLKQFIDTYQKLIKNDKLHIKQYLKVIKFIMWQLCTATHWLHSVYNCMLYTSVPIDTQRIYKS